MQSVFFISFIQQQIFAYFSSVFLFAKRFAESLPHFKHGPLLFSFANLG